MADYKLTVHVDQHWVSSFNKHNMKLCYAAGVETGSETNFNVIAFTTAVAGTITFTWRDVFFMAACRDELFNGARFTASTTIQSINFGQTLSLPTDWIDKRPNTDAKAPKAGFRFANDTESSAVLYKMIEGAPRAIYISAAGPLPPGHEDIIPKAVCRVWFANDVQSEIMIDDFDKNFSGNSGNIPITDFESTFMEIDLTGYTSAEVKYDAKGTWLNM